MLENLIKTEPDWHLKINRNNNAIGDKLVPAADVTFDSVENAFVLSVRNIPADIASGLPATLPDMFAVLARMPAAFVDGAVFRVGSADFTPRGAAFAAGDVVTIHFDRLVNVCFFTSGGSSGATEAGQFTIPVSAWEENNDFDEFQYRALLPKPGLIPNNSMRVDAFFDFTSTLIGERAGGASATVPTNGGIFFYSEAVPDDDMRGIYTIIKGVQ